MPELLPFRALRYSASAVPDLSAVLCPPYDVISAQERLRLAGRDVRNAVHAELPAPDPDDASAAYAAAGRVFRQWQADGTLSRDGRPLVYVYEQRYSANGREVACVGFFCRLRLEPYGPTSGVRPHEHTLAAAKEDRFRLMQAVGANLSPVLFLYEDGGNGAAAQAALSSLTQGAPDVDAIGPGGLRNRLWLADPEHPEARELLRLAGERPVTIADGHHRYETALRFRDEVGGGAAEYVLGLMYEAQSGGLALRPWHRVLVDVGESVLDQVGRWFGVTPVASAAELMRELDRRRPGQGGVLGVWTALGGALLEVDRSRVGRLLGGTESENLRWLDVSVLSATLSEMLGTPVETLAAEGRLRYADEAAAGLEAVRSGHAQAVFLLRPTPIAEVLAVAAAGEHMPAKSTLFYPKAATGLVFNPLGD